LLETSSAETTVKLRPKHLDTNSILETNNYKIKVIALKYKNPGLMEKCL